MSLKQMLLIDMFTVYQIKYYKIELHSKIMKIMHNSILIFMLNFQLNSYADHIICQDKKIYKIIKQ